MKKLLYFTLILFTALTFTNCDSDCVEGEGSIVTENFDINIIEGIYLDEPADVTFIQGDQQKILVTSHRNIIDRLKKNVTNGIWRIDLGNGCFRNVDLSIEITVPDLRAIEIDGSGYVQIQDFVDQNKLFLNIDGSGDIELNRFDGMQEMRVDIDGSGKIIANSWNTDLKEIDIKIDGSGDFIGFRLETLNCAVDIDGSGRVEVNVVDHLSIRIDGAGDVYYKGNPTIDQRIDGAGKVVNSN